MLYRDISKILGIFLFCLALALLVPLGIAAYYQYLEIPEVHPQPHSTWPFFWTFVICVGIAGILYWIGKDSSGNIFRREGLAAVVAIWFITPAIGALPFWFSDTLDDPVQAYFESASGLTTTGASIMCPKKYDPETGQEVPYVKNFCGIHDVTYIYWGNIDPVIDDKTGEVLFTGIEAVGKSLLFWRSCLQWLGGMGIILLFAAILPALGVGGKVLFQAELTGPLKSSLTPRLKETAAHLWKIYFGLTLLEVVILMATNDAMSLFDAITISFSTVSTGGYSVNNQSIGFYQNAWTNWVVIVFMIAGSINFTLFFYAFKGKFYRIW
jgi:trk system potassium uptake protein TrkH